jgi:hypothetical protein
MFIPTPYPKKNTSLNDVHLALREMRSNRKPDLSGHEWERLAEVASEQGVAGYLYKYACMKAAEFAIQPVALARLRKDYVSNQAVYLRYLSLVLPIFKHLNQEGIKFFIYKGCSLIERYYQDPGLRPISDIDVVVKAKDSFTVTRIIKAHGFLKEKTFGHHFYREGFCLDVHEDLFRLDRISSRRFALADNAACLWERLETLTIQGCSVGTLAPYDEFIFLCWHAMKHSFSHLKWLVDLGMMYDSLSRETNFIRYLSSLPDDSVRKSVWYALHLLHEWLGISIDPGLLESVEPGKIGRLETYAFNLVRKGAIRDSFAEVSLLGSMNGFKPKFQFIREMLLREKFDIRRAVSAGWATMKSAW